MLIRGRQVETCCFTESKTAVAEAAFCSLRRLLPRHEVLRTELFLGFHVIDSGNGHSDYQQCSWLSHIGFMINAL